MTQPPYQHEVPELLIFDYAENVGDVQREIDAGPEEVRPLAKAGKRRRKHDVSACPQLLGDAPPGPASVPRTVNEDESLRIHLARFRICRDCTWTVLAKSLMLRMSSSTVALSAWLSWNTGRANSSHLWGFHVRAPVTSGDKLSLDAP